MPRISQLTPPAGYTALSGTSARVNTQTSRNSSNDPEPTAPPPAAGRRFNMENAIQQGRSFAARLRNPFSRHNNAQVAHAQPSTRTQSAIPSKSDQLVLLCELPHTELLTGAEREGLVNNLLDLHDLHVNCLAKELAPAEREQLQGKLERVQANLDKISELCLERLQETIENAHDDPALTQFANRMLDSVETQRRRTGDFISDIFPKLNVREEAPAARASGGAGLQRPTAAAPSGSAHDDAEGVIASDISVLFTANERALPIQIYDDIKAIISESDRSSPEEFDLPTAKEILLLYIDEAERRLNDFEKRTPREDSERRALITRLRQNISDDRKEILNFTAPNGQGRPSDRPLD